MGHPYVSGPLVVRDHALGYALVHRAGRLVLGVTNGHGAPYYWDTDQALLGIEPSGFDGLRAQRRGPDLVVAGTPVVPEGAEQVLALTVTADHALGRLGVTAACAGTALWSTITLWRDGVPVACDAALLHGGPSLWFTSLAVVPTALLPPDTNVTNIGQTWDNSIDK